MIDIDSQVYTLIKGSCRKVKHNIIILKDTRTNNIKYNKGNYTVYQILCDKQWIKKSGKFFFYF